MLGSETYKKGSDIYFKDTGLRLPASLVLFHEYIESIKKRQSIFASCN